MVEIPSLSGKNAGIIGVLAVVFTFAAISFGIFAESPTANANPQYSQAIANASWNLWTIAIVFIVAVIGLVAWKASGSLSYRW